MKECQRVKRKRKKVRDREKEREREGEITKEQMIDRHRKVKRIKMMTRKTK